MAMSTRAWVIWVVVIVAIIGGGFFAYWYFAVRGAVSADVSTDTTNLATTATPANTTITIKEGWNFVSFPYNSVTSVQALQTKLATRTELKGMYRWSGSTWSDVIAENVLKPGTGYLAYFSKAATVDLGTTKETAYKKAEVPLAKGWQLVGKPIDNTVTFKATGSTSSSFLPHSDFSIKLTDGTTGSMLEAISKGYISAPLFMQNNQSSYSYLKLYDLSGNSVPDFSAFWVMPKSNNVESIIFSTGGSATGTTVSRSSLETGDAR